MDGPLLPPGAYALMGELDGTQISGQISFQVCRVPLKRAKPVRGEGGRCGDQEQGLNALGGGAQPGLRPEAGTSLECLWDSKMVGVGGLNSVSRQSRRKAQVLGGPRPDQWASNAR